MAYEVEQPARPNTELVETKTPAPTTSPRITREEAVRTVNQLITSGDRAAALFIVNTGVTHIRETLWDSDTQPQREAVARYLQDVAHALLLPQGTQ